MIMKIPALRPVFFCICKITDFVTTLLIQSKQGVWVGILDLYGNLFCEPKRTYPYQFVNIYF